MDIRVHQVQMQKATDGIILINVQHPLKQLASVSLVSRANIAGGMKQDPRI